RLWSGLGYRRSWNVDLRFWLHRCWDHEKKAKLKAYHYRFQKHIQKKLCSSETTKYGPMNAWLLKSNTLVGALAEKQANRCRQSGIRRHRDQMNAGIASYRLTRGESQLQAIQLMVAARKDLKFAAFVDRITKA